mgnify:CR=1 FL=1
MTFLDMMSKYSEINRNLDKFYLRSIQPDNMQVTLKSKKGNVIVTYANGYMKIWLYDIRKMFLFCDPINYYDIGRVIEYNLYEVDFALDVDPNEEAIRHNVKEQIPYEWSNEFMKPFN